MDGWTDGKRRREGVKNRRAAEAWF